MDNRKRRFGDFFRIKHGYAFKSEFFSDSGDFVVVTPGNFFDEGGFKSKGNKEKFYKGEVPNGYLLQKDDLIIAMTEQSEGLLGSSALIPEHDFYLHNQRLGLVVDLEEDALDKKFLYYLFNLADVRNQITATATGAKIRHTAPERILNVTFKYLPIEEQRRVAAILSLYDELIENNARRINILEEMGRRIYAEWFVQFRFRGREQVSFVESELGPIPVGWEVKKVGEIVKRLKTGTVYKGADVLENGNVEVVDQSSSDVLGYHNNIPDHHASPLNPVIIFGDHTCKIQIMIRPFSLGPNTVPFMSPDETSIYYLFYLVSGLVETKEYKRHWTELSNKQVVKAEPHISMSFGEVVNPLFEMIENLRKSISNLRKTRDFLLPKLVAGEIDVSRFDAVGEVAS